MNATAAMLHARHSTMHAMCIKYIHQSWNGIEMVSKSSHAVLETICPGSKNTSIQRTTISVLARFRDIVA